MAASDPSDDPANRAGDSGAVGMGRIYPPNPHLRRRLFRKADLLTPASGNAHEFRLTPWNNDPGVPMSGGEAFTCRDEESGRFCSPMPLPNRGLTPTYSRHGFGYSVFEHTEDGISSEAWVYVAMDAAVKLTVLKVRNGSGRSRRLSATGYVEWVLGESARRNREDAL